MIMVSVQLTQDFHFHMLNAVGFQTSNFEH